jgi:hypothetical protein
MQDASLKQEIFAVRSPPDFVFPMFFRVLDLLRNNSKFNQAGRRILQAY